MASRDVHSLPAITDRIDTAPIDSFNREPPIPIAWLDVGYNPTRPLAARDRGHASLADAETLRGFLTRYAAGAQRKHRVVVDRT
jgi:hypothetical protein